MLYLIIAHDDPAACKARTDRANGDAYRASWSTDVDAIGRSRGHQAIRTFLMRQRD